MKKLVVKEPNREPSTFALSRRHTLIGRAMGSDVTLNTVLASRMHALISQVEEGVLLSDLDSFNGTYVNGQRVAKVALKAGDRIRIGDCRISFLDDDRAAQPQLEVLGITAR